MVKFSKFSVVLLLATVSLSVCLEDETPQGKRTARRALPSVSRDHYSEVLSDGTYKFAYTGEHRYVAERRLADGTVEGESLFVRPDGVPVKVHYFADKEGYRPKTEVLYKERLGVVSTRTVIPTHVREVVVPSVREVVIPRPGPPVVIAPPSSGHNSVNVNLGGGHGHAAFRSAPGGGGGNINVNTNGGDVAAASPSVTAVVGPGGHAVIRPEAIARTSGSSKYFRSSSGSGDVAISNPHTTAIVGAGGSVVIEPKSAAFVGGGHPDVVREVHTQSVVRAAPHVQRIVERVPVPVHVPVKTVETPGYYYGAPRPQPNPVLVASPPVVTSGVVVVPPSSRYSYSYGYTAPDSKHPYRDSSAYVNVQVNQ